MIGSRWIDYRGLATHAFATTATYTNNNEYGKRKHSNTHNNPETCFIQGTRTLFIVLYTTEKKEGWTSTLCYISTASHGTVFRIGTR